jgi:hypothetical protein
VTGGSHRVVYNHLMDSDDDVTFDNGGVLPPGLAVVQLPADVPSVVITAGRKRSELSLEVEARIGRWWAWRVSTGSTR